MYKFSNEYKSLLLHYPTKMQMQLNKVFNSAVEIIGKDRIKSIILVGSTARSEISFTSKDEAIDIYSDYEYVVVTHKSVPKTLINTLKNRNTELEREFKIKSSLFSIDFGISPYMKWKFTPPTLWAFEVLSCGVTVYGDDVRSCLGPIDIGNLDMGNLNHLILVRLWNMIVHLPNSCMTGNNTIYEAFTAKLYYARNILDILTVYLPNNNILQAGYKDRLKTFKHLEHTIFNDQEILAIEQANNLKLNINNELDYVTAQSIFFTGYIKLLANVSKIDEWDYSPESLINFLDKVSAKNPFNEKILKKGRRIFNESKIYLTMLNERFDRERLHWFFMDKRYCVLGVLISLHAVLSNQYTISEKKAFIQLSIKYLEKLILRKIHLISSDIYDNVDELRKIILDFMLNWFYANRIVKKEEILKAMDYREE